MSRQSWAALGAFLAIGLVAFVAFGRQGVLAGGHQVRAEFQSANGLRKGSPVRVGGLDVGRVSGVEATSEGRALVTMRLNDQAPALRRDVRLDLEPRLAFEGNFYVQLHPGTPGAPALAADATIPMSRTSVPVQIYEVLDSTTANTREQAHSTVGQVADGLGVGDDADATAGSTALKNAADELSRTFGSATRTAQALRGVEPGDLGRSIRGADRFTRALAQDPGALSGAITHYATVLGAFASRQRQIAPTVRELASALESVNGPLRSIDAALPDIERLATALVPPLKALPATLEPTNEAFQELAKVAKPNAIPSLVGRLEAPIRAFPTLAKQLDWVAPKLTSIGKCLDTRVMPVLNARVPDGRHTSEYSAWMDVLHAAANFTGGSPGFDANGTTLRAGLSQGENIIDGHLPGIGHVGSMVGSTDVGMRPVWLGYGVDPPRRPDAPCVDQPLVDLRSESKKPFANFSSSTATQAEQERDGGRIGERLRAIHSSLVADEGVSQDGELRNSEAASQPPRTDAERAAALAGAAGKGTR